jgi:CheY-like chemotaxis protein/anti-sigma regulatory factor (Ser/Thr protein kinase)
MSSEVDSATRADVNQILTAGRHLLGLINEVLDVSRIESGELAISMETVPLVEILKESVDLVELAAQARGIVIEVDVDPLLFVKADASRLRQIFVNLLSNAVKYNRDDGRVEVSGEIVDGVVRLAVSDTGPGLPDGYEEELFTPFGRLGAETTEIEGTGLGLAVSESLAEAMDGHLSVGRSDSTGTQFCLELMRADMPVIDAAKRKARAEAALSEAGNQTSTKVRVLQVEDNPSNIRLITRIMQRRPSVELVTATSGAEAIELAVSDPPDLILLDLNLPDMSGKDVLARFRAEPTTREVRVIMLSADASEKQINAMLTAGAARYVTKPIDIAELLGIIDEALRLKESEVA